MPSDKVGEWSSKRPVLTSNDGKWGQWSGGYESTVRTP